MKILQNSDIPIYKQISTQFREEIMNGIIKEGEYLPSIRGLAKDLKISVITTMKAYEELAEEGLISAVQGKGYIVNPQDREMIREQHLRQLEQHLLNAIESARVAGVTTGEVINMIKTLATID
ncbi:MAG: GntR family transcriptional regulator [Oscillospiraceae bacterium]|nr:GntR family transcriptional regulator [Oscillospiraceae bacterium]